MEDEFDFEFGIIDPEERLRLLGDAAAALDRRATHLAPGEGGADTEEARIVRMFAEDEASLGRPEILRLARDGLRAARDGVPATLEEQTRRNAYYWLSFPVSLWTRPRQGFNSLEVKVSFNPDEADDARRPATVDAVPDHELVTRFQASTELSLAVGADLKFHAGLPPVSLDAVGVPATLEAGAKAQGTAQAKLLLAPREYAVHAARVTRSGLGVDHVRWRLEREAFVQENDPGLRVILRVPKPAKRLEVTAQMRAIRHANLFGSGLRAAIKDLPAATRDFFTGGTPIFATGAWDLSEDL